VVSQRIEEASDKSELISNEIRSQSAELDSVWISHIVSESAVPTSPTRDQVFVSYNRKIAQPDPGPIHTSIDQEARQNHASENATPHYYFHNGEPSPEVGPLHRSSNEAPYRRPCSAPNTMSIQHLVHDNMLHENPGTSDVQPSEYGRTHVQRSPATTSQPQLAADINIQHFSSNQELPQPSVTTAGSVEGEEKGVEGEREVNGDDGDQNEWMEKRIEWKEPRIEWREERMERQEAKEKKNRR
jgi:hypothetical protein